MNVIVIQWHEAHTRYEEVYGPVDAPADAFAFDALLDAHQEAWRAEHPDAPRPHISLVTVREPVA